MNNTGISEGIESLMAALKRSGVRITPQRLEIFREVAHSREHPDAEAVFRGVRKWIPNVSLDTVYRTLRLLDGIGLVNTLSARGEKKHFDGNLRRHHHFICRKCGSLADFYSGELDRINIHESVKELGNVEGLRIELTGICSECLKKN